MRYICDQFCLHALAADFLLDRLTKSVLNLVQFILDSQKTYRIFENLYVNVIKYALPNTRVYVQARVIDSLLLSYTNPSNLYVYKADMLPLDARVHKKSLANI